MVIQMVASIPLSSSLDFKNQCYHLIDSLLVVAIKKFPKDMVLKLMAASTMTMRLNLKWKAIYHIGSIIDSNCSVSLKADASRILKIIEHEVNENEIKSS